MVVNSAVPSLPGLQELCASAMQQDSSYDITIQQEPLSQISPPPSMSSMKSPFWLLKPLNNNNNKMQLQSTTLKSLSTAIITTKKDEMRLPMSYETTTTLADPKVALGYQETVTAQILPATNTTDTTTSIAAGIAVSTTSDVQSSPQNVSIGSTSSGKASETTIATDSGIQTAQNSISDLQSILAQQSLDLSATSTVFAGAMSLLSLAFHARQQAEASGTDSGVNSASASLPSSTNSSSSALNQNINTRNKQKGGIVGVSADEEDFMPTKKRSTAVISGGGISTRTDGFKARFVCDFCDKVYPSRAQYVLQLLIYDYDFHTLYIV
jgi:hypothetical protein